MPLDIMILDQLHFTVHHMGPPDLRLIAHEVFLFYQTGYGALPWTESLLRLCAFYWLFNFVITSSVAVLMRWMALFHS